MLILEALIALLISALVVTQINSTSAGLGNYIQKHQGRHRSNLEYQTEQSYGQNVVNLSADFTQEHLGHCIEGASGVYFTELQCGDAESRPIRILNSRGLSLVELLIGIAISALALGVLPTIVRSSASILSSASDFEDNVAEELLLASLLVSQIKRASSLPGIQTIKLHPAGTITDSNGGPMSVSPNILNRPAPGFTPISFMVPDQSFILVPTGDQRYCRHYRTNLTERRSSVSSITRFVAVSLNGIFELSGRAVASTDHPACPDGTYTIQPQVPSASSTMYSLSGDHTAALLLIPVRDEFTVYTANSLAVRRISSITTENQPIIMQSRFAVIGSIQNSPEHRSDVTLEVVRLDGDESWQTTKLRATSSKINPLLALDLLQ